jgi:hypothetical protein
VFRLARIQPSSGLAHKARKVLSLLLPLFVEVCGVSFMFCWSCIPVEACSRPKHVDKRNKHTKKNCAPSWLYLRFVASVSKQQNHLRNAMHHVWRWLQVNRSKPVVCQQHERHFDTNSVTNLDVGQQFPLHCCFLDSSLAINQERKWPPALKILSGLQQGHYSNLTAPNLQHTAN